MQVFVVAKWHDIQRIAVHRNGKIWATKEFKTYVACKPADDLP
ncbi:hypothetical protein YW5DRAFT_01724 [Streptomyces sp. Ncost-T6T-1]|nr:hypothetical protein YW5DRAFT_01724 [Streptomyces sp. Ncost-T6T-1]